MTTYPKLPPLQLVGYRIVLLWAPEHIFRVSVFKTERVETPGVVEANESCPPNLGAERLKMQKGV